MDLHHQVEAEGPWVVLVGGLDPGTGAGILRDLLTAVALGAQSIVVATSITDQNATSVIGIEPREPSRVGQSLTGALARAHKPVVKIGMVANQGIAHAIADTLAGVSVPVVYDPVLRASSGGLLYQGSRNTVLDLARRTTLLTPNLGEAAWLLDRSVDSVADAKSAALDLVALGIPAVLVKGGHLSGDATDVLMDASGPRVFTSPRIIGPSPRGTGCALATAIAVGLGRGQDLSSAVGRAKAWLTSKIATATKVGDEWHL